LALKGKYMEVPQYGSLRSGELGAAHYVPARPPQAELLPAEEALQEFQVSVEGLSKAVRRCQEVQYA
jgi:hypothetical protein